MGKIVAFSVTYFPIFQGYYIYIDEKQRENKN
jgi:hypothetical protein